MFFPNTEIEDAHVLLDNFREALANKVFKRKGKTLQCTISGGLTNVFKRNLESMLTQADKNLYSAKAKGRNCIIAGE